MYANWSDFNWTNNKQRQLVAFLLSIILVLVLLLIPIKLNFDARRQAVSLEVELVQKVVPKPVKIEPVEKLKTDLQTKFPPIPRPKIIKPKINNSTPIKHEVPNLIILHPVPLPSSTAILNTSRNRQDYIDISQDFKEPTDQQQDFKFTSIKPNKIYQVTKYLNEEIDKPKTQMVYKLDNNFVTTVKLLQGITGGIYDNSEKQYIDCDLESQGIPKWMCL